MRLSKAFASFFTVGAAVDMASWLAWETELESAVVQPLLDVLSATTTAPPGSPAQGDAYIIPAGATGAWSGKTGQIAVYQSSAWRYHAQRTGAIAYNAATGLRLTYNGTTWISGDREVLRAARTYYVRTDGADTNTGLANTAGGAFLTLQGAYDAIRQAIDFGGNTVTIQVGNGTYTGGLTIGKAWVGAGDLNITGDTTTPANVLINVASGVCISCTVIIPGQLTIRGFKLTNTGAFSALSMLAFGRMNYGNMDFGTCGGPHIQAGYGGVIFCTQNYNITAGATAHWFADRNGNIEPASRTITITGTPAFSAAFARADNGLGQLTASGMTFTGTATGTRYSSSRNGVIDSGGGGANYFPGNAAGSTSNGGIYI